MNKSEKVFLLSNIVLVGFVMAVVFHYVLGFYFGLKYPFNTFLFNPQIAFSDFTGFMPLLADFAPLKEHNYWVSYFPLAYIILFPFTLIKNSLVAYLIFSSLFLSAFTYTNIKAFACEQLTKLQNFKNIFILTILSYPLLSLLDRGNFDMFLFVCFVGFVYLFKAKKYYLSAIALAVINAIKPFQLIFLILFLSKKKYKEFFFSLLMTAILVFGSFLVLKGNFFDQISTLILNLADFQQKYVYSMENWGMGNNSSLFQALKMLLCKLPQAPIISTILLAKLYNYLTIIATAITIYFTWKEKVFWKQISLLTLYMLLIPQLVVDYKLIFLFVPIYLFVRAPEHKKTDLVYTTLFGLLLIPKHYFIIDLMDNMNKFSISAIINPIIMLMLISLIIREQFMSGEKNVSEEKN